MKIAWYLACAWFHSSTTLIVPDGHWLSTASGPSSCEDTPKQTVVFAYICTSPLFLPQIPEMREVDATFNSLGIAIPQFWYFEWLGSLCSSQCFPGGIACRPQYGAEGWTYLAVCLTSGNCLSPWLPPPLFRLPPSLLPSVGWGHYATHSTSQAVLWVGPSLVLEMVYMDYIDLVCCPRKTFKLNHSLTHWCRKLDVLCCPLASGNCRAGELPITMTSTIAWTTPVSVLLPIHCAAHNSWVDMVYRYCRRKLLPLIGR